jgi:prepilin-type N-terminal cleavage/methylation domain-containing protein
MFSDYDCLGVSPESERNANSYVPLPSLRRRTLQGEKENMRLHVQAISFARRFSQHGFTLAEVLVAVAIMAIAFVSLYAGIFFCFGVTKSEREDLRATQVILHRMEGFRLFTWNQITNTALNPTTFTERYLPASGTNPASGLTYTGTVAVTSVTLDPPVTYTNQMKQITVTVNWSSGNVPHSRNMTTYVSKNGVQNYIFYAN